MDDPEKTVPDSAFARHVLAERDALQDSDALNAAERSRLRELMEFYVELVALAEDYRFETKATARAVLRREKWKGWLSFGAVIFGILASAITTYISLGK